MTIKDIARLSGCGVATVSRVLNGHPDVSPATRERVLAVLERYSFQPNSNARHLKQQSGRRVAVIVKGSRNLLFADMVEQTQQRMQDKGLDAALYYLDEDANEVAFAQQVCREYKPPAVLFLGGDLEFFQRDFEGIAVPCVLLTNSAAELGHPNLSSLTTDDEAAAEQAVDYLVSRGHRRIGLLGGNWSCSQIGYRRIVGCRRSFEKHGLPFEEDRCCEPCRYSMDDAYAAAGRLLDRSPDLTAIFALADVMAVGVIRAIRDRGLRVPEDISVMGYDGILIGQFLTPRLATIRQETRRMAERGTDILLERMDGDCPPVHENVPFTLIEGESVADCRR
ncbi:MAG: LacI family DNA-binding transcriptional regulator [Candidatus Enterenecus sp.]